MKIYTKTGDAGETGLIGNVRVPKDHLRIDVYGTLDEATSNMGLARSLAGAQRTREILLALQEQFIHLSAEVAAASPDIAAKLKQHITASDIDSMEKDIDWLQERKLADKGWVLPGACPAAAAIDVARCVVRRAERLLIKLGREEAVRPELFRYLNRLSDLLYALARYEEREFILQQVREGVKARITVGDTAPAGLKCLDLEAARAICHAAQEKAGSLGIAIVAAVLDRGGNLLLLERQEEALPVSIQLAQDKAYTAFAVRKPTHELNAAVQPGEPLYGMQHINSIPLTVVGGGFPLKVGTEILGALGISGGTVEQDLEIARQALAAAQRILSA
ncbi:MAG TPA: cob(I)yrinic acid a,c-diamide adenosyltransferase [Firmicutes bacterium]|nr:cob(I)yrinic acid a,c-diamide adenosyltransferase [Bacillota bacterium]